MKRIVRTFVDIVLTPPVAGRSHPVRKKMKNHETSQKTIEFWKRTTTRWLINPEDTDESEQSRSERLVGAAYAPVGHVAISPLGGEDDDHDEDDIALLFDHKRKGTAS